MNRIIVLALLAAAALIAGDVNGTRKGDVNRPDGTKEEEVILQRARKAIPSQERSGPTR